MPEQTQASRRVGIVDIGSNSVRLVVYGNRLDSFRPVFNDKATCQLGADLNRTGKLNPAGRRLAEQAFLRFVNIAAQLRVERFEAYATAAMRDASDGEAFARHLEQMSGRKIEILSGADEALAGARGVLGAIPDAAGVVADLGGGSLEIVHVGNHRAAESSSFPLGVLRLADISNAKDLACHVTASLDGASWLRPLDPPGSLYCIGGSWRAWARLHLTHNRHPLDIVHQYSVPAREARAFCDMLTRMSRASLAELTPVSSRRRPHLSAAAEIMSQLVDRIVPDRVVFSGAGLREGLMLHRQRKKQRRRDPLLAACAHIGRHGARQRVTPGTLMSWVSGLGLDLSPAEERIAEAACRLVDIAGMEHPSYRAEHAFMRAFRLPAVAIEHTERAFLGLALAARYDGRIDRDWARPARVLTAEDARRRALAIGLTLRLAMTLAPGTENARLRRKAGTLVLSVHKDFLSLEIERRLGALASALDLSPDLQAL
ncbi:MAG: exopolyphosphatase [Alphaproteobacteria bacterium]|nr:exopolyphosphatase [Alphaproteobacteria bacterium]